MSIWPGLAFGLSTEREGRAFALLEQCVRAVLAESAEFDQMVQEKSFVPVSYLSYTQWVSSEGDFKIIFGQRGDKKGRPYICDVVRVAQAGSFLSSDPVDQALVNWANTLPAGEIAGQVFEQDGGFERDVNASKLSLCVAGQRLVLRGSITNKGAARFGLSPPIGEFVTC